MKSIISNPSFRWIFTGLSWGAAMLLFKMVFYPLIEGHPITGNGFLKYLIFYTIGGLIFGFLIKKFDWMYKKKTKKS